MISLGSRSWTLFTAKFSRKQISTKFPNFMLWNFEKQIAPCVNTGRELSFEWSHQRIWSTVSIACSKRSDSGERCEVKIAIKSRGGLGREYLSPSLAFIFFALLFTSHRSPLSERLEQATVSKARVPLQNSIKHSGSERVKVIVVAEITEEETLRPRTINTHGQLFEEFFMRY